MEILISGASTGIGRASAVHLARTGHKVWAGVRTQRDFDDFIKMNVRGMEPIFLDVTKTASIAAARPRYQAPLPARQTAYLPYRLGF